MGPNWAWRARDLRQRVRPGRPALLAPVPAFGCSGRTCSSRIHEPARGRLPAGPRRRQHGGPFEQVERVFDACAAAGRSAVRQRDRSAHPGAGVTARSGAQAARRLHCCGASPIFAEMLHSA